MDTPMATATTAEPNKGIIDKPSNHSVDQTVEKLKNILQAKGVTLFALVDHSGEAEKAGMKMLPTKVLIFGSPKAGTGQHQRCPGLWAAEDKDFGGRHFHSCLFRFSAVVDKRK